MFPGAGLRGRQNRRERRADTESRGGGVVTPPPPPPPPPPHFSIWARGGQHPHSPPPCFHMLSELKILYPPLVRVAHARVKAGGAISA